MAEVSYTEPPARLREGSDGGGLSRAGRDVEMLGTVPAVHCFVDAPGDSESVRWHVVECGPNDADTVIFLHGVPDSWWQWHHVMEALGSTRHCVAVDLKGDGQSDKRTGDYRQAGVATLLIALFDELGIGDFALITHDRGTPPGDHVVARLGERVTRYGLGQQHLWHLHPSLHPQEQLFTSPHAFAALSNASGFVAAAYSLLTENAVSFHDLSRTAAEFSHPGVASAVPRYFHSSSFRQEWIDRRTELILGWQCPVLLDHIRGRLRRRW